MEVKIPKELADRLGEKVLREYDIEEKSFSWKNFASVNLRHYTPTEVRKLRALIEAHAKVIRGGGILLKDIDTWLTACEKGGSPKPRSVEHFSSILTEVMSRAPGHRVFRKNDVHGDAWLCYYVDDIQFTPESRNRSYYQPPLCTMSLVWEEFGGRFDSSIAFDAEACLHMKPEEALARKGFYTETREMRVKYLSEVAAFKEVTGKIGKQYFARGFGTDDLDGNTKKRNRDGWWWGNRTNRIILDRSGEPSRVVIDLFQEDDKEKRDHTVHLNLWFWSEHNTKVTRKHDSDEREKEEMPIEDLEEQPVIEIPVHPFLACFDLKRHLRLRVHVNYLAEYIYDKTLGSRLILPSEVRSLVEMLVANKGVFKDIVAGKGGGAVVLCAGPPGTGKTLTAEVYAEVMERPLYSVQASQLGTDPNDLEDELLKVFARSQRWNAILLLDEADVYVHSRGNDLTQNAIVGVFLRVLEYYNGVLFLTTNRSDLVDDAIASRCMARIDYAIPSQEDQKKIWVVLSEVSGVPVTQAVIDEVVSINPELSGRDVKNLLKLAKLVSESKNEPVTTRSIEFVKRFKPTESGVKK